MVQASGQSFRFFINIPHARVAGTRFIKPIAEPNSFGFRQLGKRTESIRRFRQAGCNPGSPGDRRGGKTKEKTDFFSAAPNSGPFVFRTFRLRFRRFAGKMRTGFAFAPGSSFSYPRLRLRYSRPAKCKRVCFCPRLIVLWLTPKILPLGNVQINLTLPSLIRIFAIQKLV